MTDPSLAPDDALLRRFLLGDLTGAELDLVAAYLERHPGAADALPTPKVNDILLVALRRRESTDDSPAISDLITRLSGLSATRPDTPTANDVNPVATIPT